MYIDTITKQIKSWIPELTTLFSTSQSITGIVVVNGLATVTTGAVHNLNVGDYIYVKNAIIPIKISSITKATPTATEATIITATYHDQSLNYTTTVTIDGVDDVLYNGDLTFITDTDGYEYSVTVDSASSDSPDVTNAFMYIHKYQTINGWKEVLSVPSDTTFTYQDANTEINATINTAGMILVKRQRIFNCLDFKDSMSMYCNTYGQLKDGELTSLTFKSDNELTMYVCLDCKDRNLATVANSVGLYQYMIHLYVYKPMKDSYKYTARDIMSLLEANVLNPILGNKTLATDDLHTVKETEPLKYIGGDIAYQRDEVLYVHKFSWSFRIKMARADLKLPTDSVRWNKLDFNWTSEDSSGILNTFIADL